MKKRNLVLFGTAATLSLALAGSIGAISASAATINQGDQSDNKTTVTYSVNDAWTVQIPDSIEIGGDTGTVEASGVKIEKNKNLKVTVHSKNEWKVKSGDEGTELAYELKADESKVAQDGEVLSVAAGATTGSATLTATLDTTADENSANYSTGGASYTDELTFTVTVE